MLGFLRQRIQALCAFCKSERTINRKKNLSFMDYVMAGVCALIAMIVFFRDLDPRIFIFYILFVAIGEVFVQVRWRLSIVCPHCGFDPVLYLKQPEKAAEKVTRKLEARRNDPNKLLARKLDIPVRRVPPKTTAQSKDPRI